MNDDILAKGQPDGSGTGKAQAPSAAPVAMLVLSVVLMALFGVVCITAGHWVLGICLVLIGMVPAIFYVLMARAIVNKAFEGMGSFLGDAATPESGGDVAERAVEMGNSHLPPDKLAVLMSNYREQTPITRAWFEQHVGSFESVDVTSEDGVHLVGHVLLAGGDAAVAAGDVATAGDTATAPASHDWFIFAHGLGGGWKNGLAEARRFYERGFNLLLIEERAQGESGGEVIGAGHLERRDLVDWCRWIAARDEAARIVLMGESLGGAAVAEAVGESDLPSQVACAVTDSAYADFWNAAVHVVSEVGLDGKTMPAHPLLDVVRLMFRARKGGYDFADCSAERAVAHAQVPLLLIHSRADTLIPVSHAARLNAACSTPHKLVLIDFAGHCSAAMAEPERYWDAVFSFVGEHL